MAYEFHDTLEILIVSPDGQPRNLPIRIQLHHYRKMAHRVPYAGTKPALFLSPLRGIPHKKDYARKASVTLALSWQGIFGFVAGIGHHRGGWLLWSR